MKKFVLRPLGVQSPSFSLLDSITLSLVGKLKLEL